MSIPKVIHYCWFGEESLPKLEKKCIKSWKKKCPDYKIQRWDESNFDINICQYIQEAYEKKQWAFVSDYARLWIIYNHGGIYLDTDVELIKNLDFLLTYKAFYGFEDYIYVNTGIGFGAEPKNESVGLLLKEYEKLHFIKQNGMYDNLPCPQRNTNALLKYGLVQNGSTQVLRDETLILSKDFMSPMEYATGKLYLTDDTISIHHYKASWHTDEQKKRRVSNKLTKKQNYIIQKYGKRVGYIYGIWISVKINGIKWAIEKIKNKFKVM